MKQLKFISIILLLSLISYSTAVKAVPAYPHPVDYKLPDGTTLTVRLMGDEKVKWAETLDGYSILLNEKGFFEFATQNEKGDMIRSGIRAQNDDNRSSAEKTFLSKTPKNLRFNKSQVSIMKQIGDIKRSEASKAFPTTGNRKLICILIGFTDLAFTKTQSDFNNLFNQVGYSAGGATGSVKDYYLENSYNQFNLTVDVAGPYAASHNMIYYGENDAYGWDLRPDVLVTEAVNLANPAVNYADYDNDNNGYVDGVYVIFAGYGEEAGASSNAIWSHASSISSVTLDGKVISSYSCSPELRYSSGSTITAIGVICHEFGHVLGAPDYYDTDYDEGGEFDGTGEWDMMAGGSWNNGGVTPAHHNGFTKVYYYGWAEATELNSATTVTLLNASQNSTSFYIYNTTTSGEFFFIENREKHLFDAYLPGSGMIIYHVHSGVFNAGNYNNINNTHPQKMYPVAQNASGDPTSTPSSYGYINYSSCPWTGTGKVEFSDASLPSSKSWAGNNTGKPITNISRNAVAKTVTFDFMGGGAVPYADFSASLTNVSTGETVTFTDDSFAGDGTISSWSWNFGVGATPATATGSGPHNVSYSSLGNKTVSLTISVNSNEYTEIKENFINVSPKINEFPWAESFESTSFPPEYWVLNSNNANTWTSSTGYSVGTDPVFTINPHDGARFAYVQWQAVADQDEWLISPRFDFSSLNDGELSFWFNGSYLWSITNDNCDLSVKVSLNGGEWTQLWKESDHPNFTAESTPYTWLETIIDLSEYTGINHVQFAFVYSGNDGANFNVDNIEITGVVLPSPTITEWPTASNLIYGDQLSVSTLTGGAASVPGSFAFTNPSSVPSAGTYQASVTFTPNDNNTYSIVIGSVNVEVAQRVLSLTGSFTVLDRQYNGAVDATIGTNSLTLNGIYNSESITFAPVVCFESKEIGTDKAVNLTDASTISGSTVANYSLSLAGAPSSTADITPKELTIGGSFTATNKVYDGTTDASINNNSLTLLGIIESEVATLNPVVRFNNKNVGVIKTVSITDESAIAGANAGNYILILTGAPTTTANITKKQLSVIGTFTALDKVYDGTTSATIGTNNLTLDGIISPETVTLSPAISFDSKNVGEAKTVSVTSASLLEGADANNYSISLTGAPTANANITALELTIGGSFTVFDKEYDGTVAATIDDNNLTLVTPASGENVQLINVVTTFADAEIGQDKLVSITDAGLTEAYAANYILSLSGAPTTTASITQPVGIETDAFANLQVFPNPFTSSIILNNASEITSIVITNLIGQKIFVLRMEGSQKQTISTEDLTKGIYLIQLFTENGNSIIKKMVKK